MQPEYWIDGFNFFHLWSETRPLFQRGADVIYGQQEGLRRLAMFLGKRKKRMLVFMDGGVRYEVTNRFGFQVRYPGPGKKADDLMIEAIRARGEKAGKVIVVSSDRQLATTLRVHGARCISVDDFLAEMGRKSQKNRRASSTLHPNERYKEHQPDAVEVEAWLKLFEEKSD